MNWNILQRWKIFHFWWKIFHFGEIFFSASGPSRLPNCIPEGRCGNFSTLVENFPLRKISKKKNFYSKITWIGTFCRGGNFSTFGGKFSTLAKFCFRVLDLRVCQIWAQRCKVENFPLWWKIFHFQKVAKKKKFLFQIHMNWVILHRKVFSEKSENFPLFPKTRKFRKFILSGL